VIEDQVVIANGAMLGGHCLVEFGATLGGGAGIHHFATVGQLSFVGGMSRITKDVPPYIVVEGTPAEPRKVNTTALMRRSMPASEIEQLRAAFKLIYRAQDISVQQAVDSLRADPEQPDSVRRLCDFIERAQIEGIHGRSREAERQSRR
jgi:UDP-N-acetylglucosamine acyltransferase